MHTSRNLGFALFAILLIITPACAHASGVAAVISDPADGQGVSPAAPGGTFTADVSDVRVFSLDAHHLRTVKSRIAKGDRAFDAALDTLRTQAARSLDAGPFSIVRKKNILPASGNPQDYHSQGPYWWPNPNTPDGLPYIRRDGQRNPEVNNFTDKVQWNQMRRHVHTLGLAYYYLGDEQYARHAARLLHDFFIDPETRMNPHLEYAQAVPGRVHGRDIGIIDFSSFPQILDAIGLIQQSSAWTDEHQQGMEQWCTAYHDWLLTSENGISEGNQPNNHGTHYDVQVVSLALFLNRKDIARRVLEQAGEKRIADRITPTGEQPHETARVNGWGYSIYNLKALILLGRYAQQMEMDLWSEQSDDGRSIRQALLYLHPFSHSLRHWPHGKQSRSGPHELHALVHSVRDVYTDTRFKRSFGKIPPLSEGSLQRLTGLYGR